MSSSSNSFLRGQRKSDLLELAETVGLQKYVHNPSLFKLSRLFRHFFAMRQLVSTAGLSPHCRPCWWSCRIAPISHGHVAASVWTRAVAISATPCSPLRFSPVTAQ